MPPFLTLETIGSDARFSGSDGLSRRMVLLGLAAGVISAVARADDQTFGAWLERFRVEAAQSGIGAETLDRALADLEPDARVLTLDRHQPETSISFERYVKNVVSPARVKAGRRHLVDDGPLLEEIGRRHDVQPRFIVALWAVETDFGAVTGGFSVIRSLATLAFASSRPDLFRAELLAALRILDQTGWTPGALQGSWAGAMGQTQFMPSSYLRYAEAYGHEGAPDIWRNRADVLTSIANYLRREGWRGSETWGRRVRVPAALDHALLTGQSLRPVAAWQALGVRDAAGRDLPAADRVAGLVAPSGAAGPIFLVYDNYRILMKWNHSTYFATAVSFLADRLLV